MRHIGRALAGAKRAPADVGPKPQGIATEFQDRRKKWAVQFGSGTKDGSSTTANRDHISGERQPPSNHTPSGGEEVREVVFRCCGMEGPNQASLQPRGLQSQAGPMLEATRSAAS